MSDEEAEDSHRKAGRDVENGTPYSNEMLGTGIDAVGTVRSSPWRLKRPYEVSEKSVSFPKIHG